MANEDRSPLDKFVRAVTLAEVEGTSIELTVEEGRQIRTGIAELLIERNRAQNALKELVRQLDSTMVSLDRERRLVFGVCSECDRPFGDGSMAQVYETDLCYGCYRAKINREVSDG